MDVPRLELWFANQNLMVDVLGIAASTQAHYLPAVSDVQSDMARKQHALTELLELRLQSSPPAELQQTVLHGPPAVGELVSLEQALYFKAVRRQERVEFHAKLNTNDAWNIEGAIDTRRFPFSSTHDHLSRRQNVYLVATVRRVERGTISLRPLFIGHRSWASGRFSLPGVDDRRVHPMDVDQFAGVNWSKAPTAAEMAMMHEMPEADVKEALATVIGIPFVPKDWGGERSDIDTNNLLVKGRQMSAAWLLKGRSVSGPMKFKHLGTNGDQVERLSTDSVELLVVQHNDYITAAVVNTLQAFAFDMRRPRSYMVLDGHLTAMILRDNKLLS